LAGIIGTVATAIVALNIGMKIYAATTTLVKVANVILAGSFTTVQASVAALGAAVAIVAVTLGAFYELWREGPQAIKQTVQPFKDFALFVGATVATIGNGVIDAVQLVVNGINSMVNAAISALNLLNPFSDIDKVPMINLPNIPVPKFGGGSYDMSSNNGIFAPPSPPKSGGTMPGVSIPAMPSLTSAISGGSGGGSQGPGFNGGLKYGGGVDVSGGFNFMPGDLEAAAASANARGAAVTINVNGGISSAVDIGQSVVDALKQYTQVYGPLAIAIA